MRTGDRFKQLIETIDGNGGEIETVDGNGGEIETVDENSG